MVALKSIKNFNGRKKIPAMARGAKIKAVIIRCCTETPLLNTFILRNPVKSIISLVVHRFFQSDAVYLKIHLARVETLGRQSPATKHR